MVYFLKFGASWILPPGIFIICMIFLTFKLFKHSVRLAIFTGILTMCFYLLCTGLVSESLMGRLESVYSPPENVKTLGADSIIMLGGGAINDVPDVDGEGAICSSPASRLLTTFRLYKILGVPILLSGGQVYEDSGQEAVIAARILKTLGVPPDKILTETSSVNTTQNAKFSAEILRENNLKRPVLVTSAFHMRRSVLNFENQDVKVIPYPTDFIVTQNPKFHYTKLRPTAESLFQNTIFMQEILRTFVTRVFGI